jgi:hypothetical protein
VFYHLSFTSNPEILLFAGILKMQDHSVLHTEPVSKKKKKLPLQQKEA